MESDCPLVDTSPWADRPTVATSDPRVVLAGDLVRCDLPVALMERAATTGWQAANQLLTGWGRRGHTLWSPPTSGLLARMRRASQARNLKLRELAARVIETGDEPESA